MTCRCGTPCVVTYDALQRPRHRCPQCNGVATPAQRRPRPSLEEPPAPYSPYLAESEE